MSDPRPPTPSEPDHVHPDVELASAHLDGEVSPDERARVQSDPELRAHVDALAAVAAEIRDVPPPPPGSIDDHITAALAELDPDTDDAGGGVVPLTRRSGGGGARPWWQRAPLGAVAAVLVVVALLGVVGLASLAGDDDDTDTAATALEDSGDAAEEGADGGDDAVDETLLPDPSTTFGEESSAGGGATAAERPQFASYDELADQLDAELSTAADGAPDEQDGTTEDAAPDDAEEEGDVLRADADDPCNAVALLGLDPASVDAVLFAIVAGEPVTAVVHGGDDALQLVVVDDATCEVVLNRSL